MVRRFVVAQMGASILLASLSGCTERPSKDRFAAYFCEEQQPEHSERGECDGVECVVEGHRWGKEIAYIELDEGDLESADLIMEDKWPVPRYEPVQLPNPPTWREDPYGENYWRFDFYGLRPTAHLLWAYRETGLSKYRDKLMQVLESYSQNGASSPYGWDKHGTAFRAMVLVNTYWKLKHANALSNQEARMLEDMIRLNAVFLAKPKNFQGGYNHGFAQAAGLLLVAENFPGWPESPVWRDLAFSRYAGLLDNVIAPDGFIIENSVYYHFYVMAQVWMLVGWAQEHDVKLPENVLPTVERMVHLGAHIIQPDGNIPMLGASQTRQVRRFLPKLFHGLTDTVPRVPPHAERRHVRRRAHRQAGHVREQRPRPPALGLRRRAGVPGADTHHLRRGPLPHRPQSPGRTEPRPLHSRPHAADGLGDVHGRSGAGEGVLPGHARPQHGGGGRQGPGLRGRRAGHQRHRGRVALPVGPPLALRGRDALAQHLPAGEGRGAGA